MVSQRLLSTHLIVPAVLLGLVAGGCGSSSGSSDSAKPIAQSRVHKAFGGSYPKRFDGGLFTLRSLFSEPGGDLDHYTFYRAKGISYAGRPGTERASVTVFRTVRGARASSIRLFHGGECIDHPVPGFFTEWATCSHLRVRNILVIIAPTVTSTERRTITNALRTLGVPTAF